MAVYPPVCHSILDFGFWILDLPHALRQRRLILDFGLSILNFFSIQNLKSKIHPCLQLRLYFTYSSKTTANTISLPEIINANCYVSSCVIISGFVFCS